MQGHEESEYHHKKKDEAEAALQAIKERRERTGKGRQATQSEKKAFAAGALVQGPAAARRLVMTRIQRVYLRPPPTLSPFQQKRFLTSAASVTAPSTRPRSCTCAEVHVCRGARGKGQPILLKGITGDTVNAERADVAFPVTTIEGKRYAIFMRNQTLVVDKETETLLSVAVLLKAGFDVKFVTGTKQDPTFWRIPCDTRRPKDSHDFRRQPLALASRTSHVAFGHMQCCTFAAYMLTGQTSKAKAHGRN